MNIHLKRETKRLKRLKRLKGVNDRRKNEIDNANKKVIEMKPYNFNDFMKI